MKKTINYFVMLAMMFIPMSVLATQGGGQAGQNPDQSVSNDGVQAQVEPGSGQGQQGQSGVHTPGTGQEEPDVRIQQGQGQQGQTAPATPGNSQQNQNRTEENSPGVGQQKRQGNQSATASQAQEQKGPSKQAQQRRSRVANAVQKMLGVAERNKNVGPQIREVAQKQKQYHQRTQELVQQAKQRNGLMKFLIGPDREKLDWAEEYINKYEKKIKELEETKDRISSHPDKEVINNQIKELKQVKEAWKKDIQKERQGFSLFGWAVRLFS